MARNSDDIRRERLRRRRQRRLMNLAIKVTAIGILVTIVLVIVSVVINAGKSSAANVHEAQSHSTECETDTDIPDTRKIVVIDAGHGGIDVGTNYNKIYEKDINLSIVKRLQSVLASYNTDIRVILTRSDDTQVSLENRSVINNSYETDLFVSIHVNSNNDSSSIRGVDVYYQKDRDDGSEGYAETMLSTISSAGITTRYTHPEDFSVLRNSNCPAILIETGYITNASDRDNLNSATYQQQMAEAIAKGIISILSQDNDA